MRLKSFVRFRSHSRMADNQFAQKVRERLLFAALVLLPLLYLNIDLVRMGFRPSEAGFNIELSQPTGVVYLDEDEE